MLKALVKKQFLEMFRSYFVNQKNGQKRSKVSTVLYFLLFIGIFGFLGVAFFGIASGLAGNLGDENKWLFLAIQGLLSIVFGVFGSVFNTYAGLYLPKDNDLLLSMPIPPRTLLISRMIGVYLMSLLYSGIIWIPTVVTFSVYFGFTLPAGIFQIILLFVIALFVTFLTCILGWFVALGAQKAKGKSFVVVLLTLVFIAGYYFVYFKAIDFIESIILHIDTISKLMETWLFYLNLVGKGGCGNVLSFVVCVLLTVALFVACWLVMSHNFTKLALADTVTKRKEFSGSGIKSSGKKSALLKREFKHFVSSPVWLLNGGLGVIILPVLGVIALIKRSVLRDVFGMFADSLPGISGIVAIGVLAIVLFISCLDLITPAAVSLEGKSIWITQSLPVSGGDVLRAKEKMGFIINSVPVAVTSLLLCIAVGLDITTSALLIVNGLAFAWFLSAFGLLLNLWKPNLTWSNEAAPVKQSMSVFIALFGSWIIVLIILGCAFLLSRLIGIIPTLIITAVLIGGVSFLFDRLIVTKGSDIYEHL